MHVHQIKFKKMQNRNITICKCKYFSHKFITTRFYGWAEKQPSILTSQPMASVDIVVIYDVVSCHVYRRGTATVLITWSLVQTELCWLFVRTHQFTCSPGTT